QWWVERWLELLDSYRFKKRLERARIYAREGNVLSIEFIEARVLAKVQGSEPKPYEVDLSLAPFTDEDWDYVIETMSQKAIFSAQLLAGEMPSNIEEVFTANGLSLFPFNLSEVNSRCTCPDKANPCKHIGAVYYQLADRFSEDPFVLFQLRGRTRSQILDALRKLRSSNIEDKPGENDSSSSINLSSESSSTQKTQEQKSSPKSEEKEQLSLMEQFWEYKEPIDSSLVVIAPHPESKIVLDLLGDLPLAAADAQIMRQYLKEIYQTVTEKAIVSALNRED
ncbi:MAG: SWIM zinc finger family protein, partial [Prochloraceae cyanobacterium]|nr:SWIM zinc finger family protein [Prochloraceae cyanobacterium]